MPEWFTPASKDFWQVGAWIVAIAGGLIAAFKAIQEMRLSRQQRERELAWNQAKEVAALLNRLDADSAVRTAALMVDWASREYTLPSGHVAEINKEQVLRALRTKELEFDELEGFIRDCFDALFVFMEHVERTIEVGLVRELDLVTSLGYYIKIMAREQEVFQGFMSQYGYQQALRFAARMPDWKPSSSGETPHGEEKTPSRESDRNRQETKQASDSAKGG